MDVPFWEEAYRKDTLAFSAEPNAAVKEFEHLLDKDCSVLEVGCGEGQNVIYLAKRGFRNIDAFDISEAGISKLKRLSSVRTCASTRLCRILRSIALKKGTI